MLWEQFSAMHSARYFGKRKFISAGASVPGVNWNMISRPSIIIVWPVAVMSSVGSISVTAPVDVVCPRPAPICPLGPLGTRLPYI